MVMTEGEESTLARLATGEGTLAYLRPEVLGVFPDLRLLSNDGHHFNLNKCVLAANTGFLGGILSSGEADPDPVANITTDLSKEELGMVANFCVSGILPGLDDKSSVSRAFKQFGINLEDLDLVKEEVTGGRDQVRS